MTEDVTVGTLVHGGQGMGTLADGKKVFMWNALPNEKVRVAVRKTRRGYTEGEVIEVLQESPYRVAPRDAAYLSMSPWQIMTFDAENTYKRAILVETMERAHVTYTGPTHFYTEGNDWRYRNKMEYSFWADNNGLHLASYVRGSHRKQIIDGSNLARPEIDAVAHHIIRALNDRKIQGRQLKSMVLRCDTSGAVVVALYVRDETFPRIEALMPLVKGCVVYFSTPKSPASVMTKELYRYGDLTLVDHILGHDITYDVRSFFQVNIPIFSQALQSIRDVVSGDQDVVDLYAGVGTIGIAVGAKTLIESDASNIRMFQKNNKRSAIMVHATAESALSYITAERTVIVDPPRAGLHGDVVHRLLDVLPKKIVYLSCNPATQARDIGLLQTSYRVERLDGYNFFPKTAHIESLAVLTRM